MDSQNLYKICNIEGEDKIYIPVINKEDLCNLPLVYYKVGDKEYRVINTENLEKTM